MVYSRRQSIATDYFIDDYNLETVHTFNDLGVVMDPKLRFNLHINTCIYKAKGIFAFIKRWSKEFNDPHVTKTLFKSLVRPILEYGSPVWSPQYNCYRERLESVQKQFLLFALKNFQWNPSQNLPPYTHRLKLLDLPTLESRRVMLNVTFLAKLLNGDINSEFLLNNVNLSIPNRSSRYPVTIKLSTCRTNYAQNDPFRCLCNDFNNLHGLFDLSDSQFCIKNNILKYLN